MNTATRVTQWTSTYTTSGGALNPSTTTTKAVPVQLSQYGGNASLWKLSPPLAGNEYVVICDRGPMLRITQIQGEPGMSVPTKLNVLVEVFAAKPDGSIPVMKTIAKPISLNRPLDGINVTQILSALGYTEAT